MLTINDEPTACFSNLLLAPVKQYMTKVYDQGSNLVTANIMSYLSVTVLWKFIASELQLEGQA